MPQKIPEILVVEPDIHGDERGYFMETFRQDKFEEALGFKLLFVQDNQSLSKKGVLRGLHFQNPPFEQGKLVRVIKGAVIDVAVDIRKNSPTFGHWVGEILSAKNHKSLYIPEGFGHAYYSISNLNIIYYKLSNYYHPQYEDGILWNDKFLKTMWPTKKPIVSSKDKNLKTFLDFKKIYQGL